MGQVGWNVRHQPDLVYQTPDLGGAYQGAYLVSTGDVPDLFNLQRMADERSEEHTSELQSLMRTSYAVFCLKKKKTTNQISPYSYSYIHCTLQYSALALA